MRNQMFFQMNLAAMARLVDRNTRERARNAGVIYDQLTQSFLFRSLGTDVAVHCSDFSM